MATRTTRADLEASYASLKAAAQTVGIETVRWRLITGSKTYGIPYEIVERDPDTGGHSATVLGQRLGMTTREAFDALFWLRRGVLAQTAEYRRKTR